ncbi:hypothetical protein CEXT_513691 [Caerostris extrusa]|uniref:Uncharacterized protein n=1 Tax=Caerostris extrusa TaxID=172846 RepID=A0AAV4RW57_CAEEX|nr:hypothetical protein CEXT_513691 [Caerostris extrusa]
MRIIIRKINKHISLRELKAHFEKILNAFCYLMIAGIQHLFPKLFLHRLLYRDQRYVCDILIQTFPVSFTPEISFMTLLGRIIVRAQAEITPYRLPVLRGLLGNVNSMSKGRRIRVYVPCKRLFLEH